MSWFTHLMIMNLYAMKYQLVERGWVVSVSNLK